MGLGGLACRQARPPPDLPALHTATHQAVVVDRRACVCCRTPLGYGQMTLGPRTYNLQGTQKLAVRQWDRACDDGGDSTDVVGVPGCHVACIACYLQIAKLRAVNAPVGEDDTTRINTFTNIWDNLVPVMHRLGLRHEGKQIGAR